MRYAALALGLWLGWTLGCRADSSFEKVHGAEWTGYLVPKVKADGWMRTYNDPKWLDDGQCWTPTATEALAAEKAVRHLITRAQQDAKLAFPDDPASALELDRRQLAEIDQKYPRYEIQFVGIRVKGKKEIFCNFFCRDATGQLNPARDFIFVYDGGSCFWHLEYIPETKTCTGLQINGDA